MYTLYCLNGLYIFEKFKNFEFCQPVGSSWPDHPFLLTKKKAEKLNNSNGYFYRKKKIKKLNLPKKIDIRLTSINKPVLWWLVKCTLIKVIRMNLCYLISHPQTVGELLSPRKNKMVSFFFFSPPPISPLLPFYLPPLFSKNFFFCFFLIQSWLFCFCPSNFP